MLSPKRIKFRKIQKGRLGGKATDEDVFGARMTKKHITGPGGQ